MISLIVAALMLTTAVVRPKANLNIDLDGFLFLDMILAILGAIHYGII